MGKDGRDAERITTTFTKEVAARLDAVAKKHSVSKAWIIRRAVERALEDDGSKLLLPLDSEGGKHE